MWRELLEEVYDEEEQIGTGFAEFEDYLRRKQPIEWLLARVADGSAEFSVLVARVEDLRQSTPTHIAHQHPFLVFSCRTAFSIEFLEQLDGGEIGAAFLLERTHTEPVHIRDAIVVLIAWRLRLRHNRFGDGRWRDEFDVSGGRKQYRSRTISQARYCACGTVNPSLTNCRRN